jgi:hypothetical protein
MFFVENEAAGFPLFFYFLFFFIIPNRLVALLWLPCFLSTSSFFS